MVYHFGIPQPEVDNNPGYLRPGYVLSYRWAMRFSLFGRPHDASTLETRLVTVEGHVKVLYERVLEIDRSEAVRNAEHAAMVDRLERLYKRMATRIARENGAVTAPTDNGESVLAMRRRLGR